VVAGIGFLVAMVDGYDTLMLAFIAPLIAKEWALHPQTVGAIFASSYAGAALGATAIGMAADRFGRKTMLLASLALVAVFTMLCARSANPAQLMVLRALAGLGLGGALSTSIALVAENAAVHQRRVIVTRMFLGFPIGAIVGGAVTAGVMSSLGWRGVFLAGGVCALLLIPLVALGVTESAGGAQIAARVHSRRPLTEVVSGGRAWITLLFCVSVFLMLLTSYFLVSWIPTVLTLNGMSAERAAMAAVIINLRRHRRHLNPVVHLRPQESAGARRRVSVFGRHPDCAARSRHRLAREHEISVGVCRGPVDHRGPRLHPGTGRASVSGFGLCDRRRAIRSMRPIGVDHRPAGRGLPGVRTTGMEPVVSVGGCARDVGCDCRGSARSITTKRGRAPMNCSDNAARRNGTPRFRGNVASSTGLSFGRFRGNVVTTYLRGADT